MPYLFIDDGAPEASEYADNYLWFAAEALPAMLSSLRGPRVSEASNRSPSVADRDLRLLREGQPVERGRRVDVGGDGVEELA